jgi:hypothetical protein
MLIDIGPQVASSTPAQTSVTDTASLVLITNAKRKGFTIQNTGTTLIKLSFGLTAPTTTAYHVCLKGGTAANDGTGGVYMDDAWVGNVWALGEAAGGTCVITEFRSGSPDWNAALDWGL